jgi:hypothetical protein
VRPALPRLGRAPAAAAAAMPRGPRPPAAPAPPGSRTRWPRNAWHQPDGFPAFFNKTSSCTLAYAFSLGAGWEAPASDVPCWAGSGGFW